MKKLHIILTMALLLAGCTLEEMRESVPKIDSKSFNIEQAKDFFEKDFATAVTKASSDGRKHGKLHPGDFTPLWDKAVYSQNGKTAAYDISILTDRRITASRGNCTETETVRVYQKLVITQNTISGKMTAYIMSLVPEKDNGHFPKSFSSRKSYRGNYSGIVVYTTVDSGALVRVQEYRDGELYRGVFIPSGEGSYAERCRKAAQILKGIRLTSKRLIMTKSGEDWDDLWDDDDYDGWNLDDFFDLGDGIYTDGDGNYYLDIDEDGDIDMETIAPGIIEDEYTGEDPWPPADEEDQENRENDTDEDEELMNDIEEDEEYEEYEETNNNPAPLNDINLFEVNQHFTKYSEANNNCLDVCKRTMDKMGQSNYGSSANVIYLVRENDTHTALVHYGDASQYYTKVTECINRHLDAESVIIAGVNHTLERGINDGTIDHFVLIVGREYNSESGYYEYLYIETGTNNYSYAQDGKNKLIYDDSKDMYINYNAYCGPEEDWYNTYTLTELRPNDGDTSDTIVQPAKIRKFNFYFF